MRADSRWRFLVSLSNFGGCGVGIGDAGRCEEDVMRDLGVTFYLFRGGLLREETYWRTWK